jgi:hypothetical protein
MNAHLTHLRAQQHITAGRNPRDRGGLVRDGQETLLSIRGSSAMLLSGCLAGILAAVLLAGTASALQSPYTTEGSIAAHGADGNPLVVSYYDRIGGGQTPVGAGQPRADSPTRRVQVLHSYQTATAWEIATLVPVDLTKVTPLLPDGFQPVPASAVGVGTAAQGVVVLAQYQGIDGQVDSSTPRTLTAIDEAILIAPPADAALAGVDIPGAFHFYAIHIFTDDAPYAATLHEAGMPVSIVPNIAYDRQIDDASGMGSLGVALNSDHSSLQTLSTASGYQPAGTLVVVFWFKSDQGEGVLDLQHADYKQGPATSRVYPEAGSQLDSLLAGGGLGDCGSDPVTGDPCILAPALDLRYPIGSRGKLILITP